MSSNKQNSKSFHDGLAQLRRESLASMPPEERAPIPRVTFSHPPSPNQDGNNHVNVSTSARTELGKILSFSNTLSFFHDGLGLTVPTLFHFWVFLNSGGNNFRVFGYDGNRVVSENNRFTGPRQIYTPNQYALLAQAMWKKMKSSDLLSMVISEYRGNFDYYLTDHRGVRRPKSAALIVEILINCRNALRNNRELDLTPFMDQDCQLELVNLKFKERAQRIEEILEETLKPVREAAAANAEAQRLRKEQQQKAKAEAKPAKAKKPVPHAREEALTVTTAAGNNQRVFAAKPVEQESPAVSEANPEAQALEAQADGNVEVLNIRPFTPVVELSKDSAAEAPVAEQTTAG